MSINIRGHANHYDSAVLTIKGRLSGGEVAGPMAEDSAAICKFFRTNLPCGTLDRLAARLAGYALDSLVHSGRLDEEGNTNDVREALATWIMELDTEILTQ